jgi:hypothetical protein
MRAEALATNGALDVTTTEAGTTVEIGWGPRGEATPRAAAPAG